MLDCPRYGRAPPAPEPRAYRKSVEISSRSDGSRCADVDGLSVFKSLWMHKATVVKSRRLSRDSVDMASHPVGTRYVPVCA